jgi:hypothetical protein
LCVSGESCESCACLPSRVHTHTERARPARCCCSVGLTAVALPRTHTHTHAHVQDGLPPELREQAQQEKRSQGGYR